MDKNSKIKALFFDIDGTLEVFKHIASHKVLLKRWKKRSKMVSIYIYLQVALSYLLQIWDR